MREIIVDLFAGGGGASIGIEQALGVPVDVAINHDETAIEVYRMNHPGTELWCSDLWRVSPTWVTRGRPVGLLWASPDCTHHSKAKGGPPNRDSKKRDMAWIVEHWAREVKPRVIMMENVEEFLSWGPLDSRGKVVTSQRGSTFRAFLARLRRQGYSVQYRELRACDYGAPTSRKRLFVIARRDGRTITWPAATHGPGTGRDYRTAAECLDFSLPCPSIFLDRDEGKRLGVKRPLAENTMRRIAKGVQRFVIESPDPFIVSYYGQDSFRGQAVAEPLRTIPTENRFGLVAPWFVPRHGERIGQEPRTRSALEPLPTVTATSNGATLVSAFMAKHYGGVTGHELRQPVGTVTARDHHSLVTSNLLCLRNNCAGSALQVPAPTVTAGGNHVGEVRAFLVKYFGTSFGQDVRDPLGTVTGRHRYGVVVTLHGQEYVIADIGMRMLQPFELFLAQGFPEDYRLNGVSKTRQVQLCGNSVPPPFSRALVGANYAVRDVSRDRSRLPLMRRMEAAV